ncbi:MULTISPECIES: hypothetical protein [Nostocales]|uniref:Transposase n=2 Tax=Nostocales TaxID=1161 RepID=A0ABW8WSI3_9CYAN|nr:hypothetical protein [Tolypothrix bouteillei]
MITFSTVDSLQLSRFNCSRVENAIALFKVKRKTSDRNLAAR